MAGRRDVHTVVLHVGLPKSGTTYLQRSLAANAEALGDRGVLYPHPHDDLMFRAALDVRGTHKAWGRTRSEVDGAWDSLCATARAHTGTTVVSHELLAAATRRQVVAAGTMLAGLDVHVVVTVRDVARQLVAEWQEGVKHGRRATFADYHARVARGEDELAQHFHASQDLPDVLARWGQDLPADHVHVVVGEPEGADPAQLWTQFAAAVGFDPAGFPPVGSGHANPSLGVAEVDLLRRVNIALDGRLPQPAYGRLVKHRLAHTVLSPSVSPRPQLPASLHDTLVPVAERWVKEVRKAGYAVHGDLRHLVPVPSSAPAQDPDDVSPDDQVAAAATAIASLLLDVEAAEARAAERDDKRRSWKRQAKHLRRRLAELTD